jgi:hypothetical protein
MIALEQELNKIYQFQKRKVRQNRAPVRPSRMG